MRGPRAVLAVVLIAACLPAASAQDIRGLEACMAEKAMERRTGCLQANVEFLQQELARLKRETAAQIAAAKAEAKVQNDALKAALSKIETELAQIKARADTKPEKK